MKRFAIGGIFFLTFAGLAYFLYSRGHNFWAWVVVLFLAVPALANGILQDYWKDKNKEKNTDDENKQGKIPFTYLLNKPQYPFSLAYADYSEGNLIIVYNNSAVYQNEVSHIIPKANGMVSFGKYEVTTEIGRLTVTNIENGYIVATASI